MQEQIKIMREGFKKKRHNQFYTGSPQGLCPVFSAQLAKKVPLTQLIIHMQLINQFLLSVEIKNPAKLINCSPQLPINFSRNTKLTQFLLPVEIKNLAKLISCSPQLPINFNRNTKLTQFLLPVKIKNSAKLINCSPQLPINFSRNIRLTPIAQTNTIIQWLSQNYNEYNTNLDSNRIKKGWENYLIGAERKPVHSLEET